VLWAVETGGLVPGQWETLHQGDERVVGNFLMWVLGVRSGCEPPGKCHLRVSQEGV
jgi:hypothetical protein